MNFVNNVFSEKIEYAIDLFPYLEKPIKSEKGTVAKKGRTDALLGNLIIEFKQQLDTEHLEQAKQQLKKYISIIWGKESHQARYLLFASDGIENKVYRPKLMNEEIKEENIETWSYV